jgi:hypothetical protein
LSGFPVEEPPEIGFYARPGNNAANPAIQLGPPQTADQAHIQAVKVQRLDSFFFLFFISHESRMKNF